MTKITIQNAPTPSLVFADLYAQPTNFVISLRGRMGGGLLKTQFVFTPWPHIWHKWRKSVCTSRNLLCFSDWVTSQPRAAWKEGTCATAGYDARAAVKPVWPKSSGCTLVPECLIIDTVTLPKRRRRSWSSAAELSALVSIVCVTEQRLKNVT